MSVNAMSWAYEQELDTPTKFVLVTLGDHADHDNVCFPSQATLSKRTGLSERAVRRSLAKLEELHLILRIPRRFQDLPTSDWYQLAAPIPAYPTRAKNDSRPVPFSIASRVYVRDGFTCQGPNCGVKYNLTLDHVIPRSKGGETTIENLEVLCNLCNSSKKNRLDWKGRQQPATLATNRPNRPDQPATNVNEPATEAGRVPATRAGKSLIEEEPIINPQVNKKRAFPENYILDGVMRKFAQDRRVNAEREWEAFENYHRAKGTISADWNASWRTWVLNAVRFGNVEAPKAPARDEFLPESAEKRNIDTKSAEMVSAIVTGALVGKSI